MIRIFMIIVLVVVLSVLLIRIPQNRQEISTWSDFYAKQQAEGDQKMLQKYQDEGKILIIK